jgi:hypothetical protein
MTQRGPFGDIEGMSLAASTATRRCDEKTQKGLSTRAAKKKFDKAALFSVFRELDVGAANDADGLVTVAARVEQQ